MLYVVTEHFFQLLWANILCVVFSIPLVTAPAAMSGLHAVISQYYRKGYGDVWPAFIEEFKNDFMQKLFSATEGLKNALILSFLEPSRSLGLIAAQAVCLSLMVWFYPVSCLAVLFVFPLVPAVFTELTAFPVIEKRLIRS